MYGTVVTQGNRFLSATESRTLAFRDRLREAQPVSFLGGEVYWFFGVLGFCDFKAFVKRPEFDRF